MDDVKDKMKGLIKKVNNPFTSSSSSSSSNFKGPGRVLGSSSSSSAPTPSPAPAIRPRPPNPTPPPKPAPPLLPTPQTPTPNNPKLSNCITTFTSSTSSTDTILKILNNIIKDPHNPKFRKLRLSNPKIREAVVEVDGGMELLECVGFRLQEEEAGEMWAVISDVPTEEEIGVVKDAVAMLERGGKVGLGFSIRREAGKVEEEEGESRVSLPGIVDEPSEPPQKIDRQTHVFFSASESIAAKIDLPDSFYNLSAMELKRESEARKKQLAESQLLIPKSYKEKKAKDARKRYTTTVIRIQFPDEVVLQGVFLPSESTTALYEFVSSSLKQPCLEFELWRPAVPRSRMIPRFSGTKDKRATTLDEEDLVPTALIKFKPIETDSIVFTGLSNELLESSRPLTNTAVVSPA